jgi:hypothetical protein
LVLYTIIIWYFYAFFSSYPDAFMDDICVFCESAGLRRRSAGSEPFLKKRFRHLQKTFGKIIGLIFSASVLFEQTASSYWGPCPKGMAHKLFRVGTGGDKPLPYRFDFLSAQTAAASHRPTGLR